MMIYYKYKEAALWVLPATIIPALAHFLPFWPMEYGVCFPTTGPSWTGVAAGEILLHRILWSLPVVVLFLLLTDNINKIKQLFDNKKVILTLCISATLNLGKLAYLSLCHLQ
jgi:hypothetical protein